MKLPFLEQGFAIETLIHEKFLKRNYSQFNQDVTLTRDTAPSYTIAFYVIVHLVLTYLYFINFILKV